MKKKYLFTFLFSFVTLLFFGQDIKSSNKNIEGLSIYPNPVSNGKVFISTKNDFDKEIVIFDILGKKCLQTFISNKELNVANLIPGVYILQITENQISTTRKLVIK